MEVSRSENWQGELMEATSDPNISVSAMESEVPTLTATAIAGVALVVLLAIAAVFLLGVLIDWRQQRMLEKKMGEVKRLKNQRRVNVQLESDDVSIANNMEEPGVSAPPADLLRNLP